MAIRTLLVIGKNHEEIAAKYSLDTKVEKYVKMKLDDAGKCKDEHLKLIEKILNNNEINLTKNQKEYYNNLFNEIKEMDDFDYFCTMTKGCYYDENSGDAYSTTNPDAHYQYQRCPQKRLIKTGEEAEFSNPFKLKGGNISYSAAVGDIEWKIMHMNNTYLYEKTYNMIVNGEAPENAQEEQIKYNMKNRQEYFKNFKTCEDYVNYSCSFWTYGVALEDNYYELDYTTSDKEWVVNYYDRFIKDLPDDEILTIYEIKTLD